MLLGRAEVWIALAVSASFASSPAAAQQAAAAASPAAPRVVVDGVTIDGPPPPEPPAVESRAPDGRATFRANRLTRSLRIDGKLDEEVYVTTPAITHFYQIEPNNGQLATEQTEVWIFFDDHNLYVSVRCYDSAPEERWVANEMRRDSTTISRQNDAFHIAFDTFYDRRNSSVFVITPIGGIYDGQVTNEGVPANPNWNPVWDRAVGRFEKGWTAEMAIPFKSLRYKPGRRQVWGVTLFRLIRWKNESTVVVPLSRLQKHSDFQVSRYATLVGIEAPPGSKNVEIKPYAISNAARDPVASAAEPNKIDADAGFDVKYGVTQNLTADFTYNTDFAQVEVDEQQVNLTRFNLFFPEKREFFIEGAGVYLFGITGTGAEFGGATGDVPALFYTRQIGISQGRPVPIDAGGRLTGKVGKFSIGLINVQTEGQPGRGVPATNFSVVRLRRDILRRSNVGLLYTRRSASLVANGPNEAYGVDAVFGFFTSVTMTSYLAQTRTPGRSGDDTSYRVNFDYNADRYGAQLERLTVDRNFNPELGFVRRLNFEKTSGSLRFSPRPRNSRTVRQYNTQVNYDYITDSARRLDTRDGGANFGITLQNGDNFNVNYNVTDEFLRQPFRIARGVTIPVGAYGYQSFSTSYGFGIQRKVSGTVSVESGSFYSGDRTALTWRAARVELSPQVSLEPAVSINRVVLPEGRFTTKLVSTRATYTVTPRMFFSGLMQYSSSTQTVSANLRLRWEYHPGSELFIVYTDERDTGAPGFPRVDNRAFAVKINRLIRF
jgi:hypothetical protein